ncbi:alpha/beta hydrolase [Elioraea thermophila]|uniref:alpha/beta hydrolase n=1 Tax=Elioraea thermophila TaxID=2185104 RepID=UPI001300709C|nr:alpha/beta hydrolase [Elioraea thermophila]
MIPFRARAAGFEPERLVVGDIEVLRAGERNDRRPALLFLHGASAAAWVWAEHLMEPLAATGWRCVAVSFRGHGGSHGRALLHGYGLLDYLLDARAALASLDGPAIVIGHSLGGLVAQMLLGDPRLRGVVLMAPVPPEGLAAASLKLAFSDPDLWREVARMPWAEAVETPPQRLRRALFSEALPDARAWSLLQRFQSESLRAVAEAQWPRPVASARLLGLPALVLSSRIDPLVPADAVVRTSWLHGADHVVLETVAHAMMLDHAWGDVVRAVVAWLEARFG